MLNITTLLNITKDVKLHYNIFIHYMIHYFKFWDKIYIIIIRTIIEVARTKEWGNCKCLKIKYVTFVHWTFWFCWVVHSNYPKYFQREIHSFTKSNSAFHLVVYHYNFLDRARERGRKSVTETKSSASENV